MMDVKNDEKKKLAIFFLLFYCSKNSMYSMGFCVLVVVTDCVGFMMVEGET